MEITINGQPKEVANGTTLAALLIQFDLGEEKVAVERNGTIVPRSQFHTVHLMPNDALEVVRFVGGG